MIAQWPTCLEAPSSYLNGGQWDAIAARLGLGKAQIRVVQGIVDGLSEDSISARLGVPASTVRAHLLGLFTRLGIRDRRDLVTRAFVTYLDCEREARFTPRPGD